MSSGQIYVKLLPNGESVRLTTSPERKYGPVFTLDGSRIAYTQVDGSGSDNSWDTWTVPVLGGPPTKLLPNASGLTWLGGREVLFSEIKDNGIHMGIVKAAESRAEERAIYFPAHERGMAHYSYPSPDRASILVVEMDGQWRPCRLIPFDGRSAGRQVGPDGGCTSTAWSPDGRLMYFGAMVRGSSHLWRQRFPDGTPEQITFGPTEEEGIAMAADGKSLITSVGQRQSSIWIHDAGGDRPLSSEGFAVQPRLAAGGHRAYFLRRQSSTSSAMELYAVDLGSGKLESLLPGVSIADYEVSDSGHEVVFTTTDGGVSTIWLASLDRRSPPREIASGGDSVSFGSNGELVFRQLEKEANYLARMKRDGSGIERIGSMTIHDKFGVSPDGEWTFASVASGVNGPSQTVAVPTHGGVFRKICSEYCPSWWSADGKFLYLGSFLGADAGKTLIVPIPAGKSLPDFPASGIGSVSGWDRLPASTLIDRSIASGLDASTYLFAKTSLQRNLFRISLH